MRGINFFNKNRVNYNYYWVSGIYFLFVVIFLWDMGFITDDYFILPQLKRNIFPFLNDWTGRNTNMLRPVSIFYYYVNNLLFKSNAFYYYLCNSIFHFFNSLLLLVIAKKLNQIFKLQLSEEKFFILFLLYLFIPQNIANFFWIAGITDILSTFFGFLAFIVTLKSVENRKIIFLILYFVFSYLSLLSKETGLFFQFVIFIFLIFRKKYSLTINVFSLVIIYFFHRYLAFGTNFLGGNSLNLINFLKFNIYGIFSLLIPFDILDLYFFERYNIYLFIFFSLIIFSYLLLLTDIFFRTSKKQRFYSFLLTLLGYSSIFIYLKNSFPSLRLMYPISGLIILAFLLLDFSSKIKTILISIVLVILVVISDASIIISSKKINNYTRNLENTKNILKENKTEYNVFLLVLGRISQRWAKPNIDLWSEILNVNTNNIYPLLYYETFSFAPKVFDFSIEQKDGIIILNVKNTYDGIVLTPSKKIKRKNWNFGLGKIEIIDFQKGLRKGLAKQVKITLNKQGKYYIIYPAKFMSCDFNSLFVLK